MLRSILIASSFFLHQISIAQTKDVEINQLYRYTVPEGKVVELTNNKSYKLILSDGVSRSGSACNSAFYSNPSYVYGICYYENIEEYQSQPKTIGFTFKEINHYHDDVYQIKPYYLLNDNMGMDDLRTSSNWKFSTQKIVFYPGMSVFPSSCIKSIMLTQRDMSDVEKKAYAIIKRKRLEVEMAQDKKNTQVNKENLDKQKFDDPKSIYVDTNIYNINQIKLSDSIIPSTLKILTSKIEKLSNSDFTKLSDNLDAFAPLFIVGTWDNNGDIQSLRLVDDRFVGKHRNIEIKFSDSDDENIKKYLKLPNPPLVKHNDSLRTCYFEGYLFSLKILIKNQDHFFFKKTKKNFIYKTGYYSSNRELFEEAFKIKYSPTELGEYELSLFFVNYQLTVLSEIFQKEEKHELKRAIIFPYSR